MSDEALRRGGGVLKLSIGALMSSVVVGLGAAHAVLSCAENAAPEDDVLDASPAPDAAIVIPAPDAAPPPQCGKDVWCTVALPPSPVSLNGVWGAAPDDVWIVGSPDLTLHWDGATLATGKTDSRQTLFGVWGSGKSDVWTFSAGNAMWHSSGWTDAGPAWSNFDGGSGADAGGRGWPGPASAMTGTSASDVWTVGPFQDQIGAPTVWHADGWKNGAPVWSYAATSADDPPAPEMLSFNAVFAAPDASEVWIVGMGGKTRICKRTNASTSMWLTVNSLTSEDLYAVYGASKGDVWAAGAGGTMRRFTRTADDTVAAAAVTLPTDATIMALTGFGADDVWGVGAGGAVVHWDGMTWSLVDVPATGHELYAIWGSSAGDLWIVGRDILLYKGSAALPGRSL